MKSIKRLSMAAILAVVLAVPAFAGTIHTGVADPPPPPPPESPTMSAQGNIHTGDKMQDPSMASDSVTDVVLMVLQSLQSVF